MTIPLLIGGATTSRQHTAVKIAPEFARPTVHVLDASRAVATVASLLDDKQLADFDRKNREEQEALRELHGGRRVKQVLPFAEAQANRLKIELAHRGHRGARVHRGGARSSSPLRELVEYIDWTFFFTAWELKGRFPQILEHPQYGEAARDLYKSATKLLSRIVDEKLLTARATYGFWPANSDGNDVVLWADAQRSREVARFHMLRQQQAKTEAGAHLSLADFVAPTASGLIDYVGAFAVTAGIGADELARTYERQLDDYSAIICKALADRLAEASAEMLHQRARQRVGLWRGGDARARRADRREVSRHPAGVRLSGLSGSRGEAEAVRAARRGRGGDGADRELRDDAGGERQRHVLRASASALFQRRQDRARSGGGVRGAQGRDGGRGGALVGDESRVRGGGGERRGVAAAERRQGRR